MAYVKVNSSQSAYSRLKYIFDDKSHDGSKARVLDTVGGNIRLWGDDGNPYAQQSGYYINTQFKQLRQHAYNRGKRIQVKHMIISFSYSEFETDDLNELNENSKKANKLVKEYMDDNFPEVQYVSAIQCDGSGHKLHAHVLINTIATSGKCVRTNKFEINKVRNSFNIAMEKHYSKVKGKPYHNPFDNVAPMNNPQPKGWQAQLRFILKWARNKSDSIDEYEHFLNTKSVSIKKRNKKGDLSYLFNFNGKIKTVRDFYQRLDKRTGKVKTTRGMGKSYTPQALNRYFYSKQKKPNKFLNDLNNALNQHQRQHHNKYSDLKNQRGL